MPTSSRNDDDEALQTARDVLDNLVCECGDTDSDHVMGRRTDGDRSCCECECREFRPVRFVVVRARRSGRKPRITDLTAAGSSASKGVRDGPAR